MTRAPRSPRVCFHSPEKRKKITPATGEAEIKSSFFRAFQTLKKGKSLKFVRIRTLLYVGQILFLPNSLQRNYLFLMVWYKLVFLIFKPWCQCLLGILRHIFVQRLGLRTINTVPRLEILTNFNFNEKATTFDTLHVFSYTLYVVK